MKQVVKVVVLGIVCVLALAGCRNGLGVFSNGDGQFVLSPNGTYLQTFLPLPNLGGKPRRGGRSYGTGSLDALPNSGTWRLIGPSDGPANSGYKVELSGVRSRYAPGLAGTYTLVLPASSIHGLDKLLKEQKGRSAPGAP